MYDPILPLVTRAQAALSAPAPPRPDQRRTRGDLGQATTSSQRRTRGDLGQATTEYALILLGAALVGLLVVAWATGGGASGRIGQLFDRVIDSVMSRL